MMWLLCPVQFHSLHVFLSKIFADRFRSDLGRRLRERLWTADVLAVAVKCRIVRVDGGCRIELLWLM